MKPEDLWRRYAAIWSLDAGSREEEMEMCLAADVTYCDPNGLIEGSKALSAYMGAFQRNLTGSAFRILAVSHHHDRTLAHWALHGVDRAVIQTGASYGLLADDGRLRTITGFVCALGQDQSF